MFGLILKFPAWAPNLFVWNELPAEITATSPKESVLTTFPKEWPSTYAESDVTLNDLTGSTLWTNSRETYVKFRITIRKLSYNKICNIWNKRIAKTNNSWLPLIYVRRMDPPQGPWQLTPTVVLPPLPPCGCGGGSFSQKTASVPQSDFRKKLCPSNFKSTPRGASCV